jgi:hypothetical protein
MEMQGIDNATLRGVYDGPSADEQAQLLADLALIQLDDANGEV